VLYKFGFAVQVAVECSLISRYFVDCRTVWLAGGSGPITWKCL